MTKLNSDEIRIRILQECAYIESALSLLLGDLLNIVSEESDSLSIKPSALSLNQKIDLVTDMDIINEQEAKSLKTFKEICFQFMHNLNVYNFENCLARINEKHSKYFKSLFKKNSKSQTDNEQTYLDVFEILTSNVRNVISKIAQERDKQKTERTAYKIEQDYFSCFVNLLYYYKDEDVEFSTIYDKIVAELKDRFPSIKK